MLTAVAAMTLSAVLAAQSALPPAALLKAAINREVVDGDITGAMQQYKEIATEYSSNHVVAAGALLRLGGLYERQGDRQAKSTYERIVNDYADTGATAKAARARLAAIQQADSPFPERIFDRYAGEMGRPSVSPDGKWIAYLTRRPGNGLTSDGQPVTWLCVRSLANGKEDVIAKPKHPDEMIISTPAWSPDSQRVAYGAFVDRQMMEPRVTTVSARETRVIGSRTVVSGPAPAEFLWSPDSQWVVSINRSSSDTPAIEVTHVPSGKSRPLGTTSSYASGVRWAPDSRRVAFVSETGLTIKVVSVADGTAVDHQAPQKGRVTLRSWGRDNRIFFSQSVTGGNDFYAMPADGGDSTKTCEGRGDSGGDGCGLYSADGLWQATRKNVSGGGRIMLRNTRDGSERPLTPESVFEAPVSDGFSPDGRLFAFRSNRDGNWGVYVVAVDRSPQANPAKVIALESQNTAVEAWWTATGLAIWRADAQTNLYKVEVDAAGRSASGPVRLTESAPWNASPFVSPDGKRIAYLSRAVDGKRSLSVMESNGSSERNIRDANLGTLLGWRSRTEVLLGEGRLVQTPQRHFESTLRTLDVGTGAVTEIGVIPCTRIQYSPSTDTAFCTDSAATELSRYALTRLTLQKLPLPPGWFDYTAAQNGRVIAYSTTDEGPDGKKKPVPGETRLRSLDSNEDRTLLSYPDSKNGSHMTYEFSPDVRFLLYLNPSAEVRVVDTRSGESWPLLSNPPSNAAWAAEPSWSPDGRFIVIGGSVGLDSLRVFTVAYEAVTKAPGAKK
jgi:Tol biopolymer transport system component